MFEVFSAASSSMKARSVLLPGEPSFTIVSKMSCWSDRARVLSIQGWVPDGYSMQPSSSVTTATW